MAKKKSSPSKAPARAPVAAAAKPSAPTHAAPWRGHVIAHTHWDRAWYWSAAQTLPRLVDLMDALLELMQRDAGFRHFVLDGQLAMLVDYLALRPEQAPLIAELTQQGRLVLGPFFVLPDLFIPSGESLIRNCELGRALAAPFGPTQTVAYLPDPFGLPEQLPQILRQLGIADLIFSRGRNDVAAALGASFWWQSPDGSAVLASCQSGGGYCNLARLGCAEGHTIPSLPAARAQLARVVAALALEAPHGELLLNAGCDHLLPQAQLPQLIEALNAGLAEGVLHFSTPERYQGALHAQIARGSFSPGTYRGELRGAKDAYLLAGVHSARGDLKQAHAQAERTLLRWCEPFAALAQQAEAAAPKEGPAWLASRDGAALGHAWRWLLLCQPHDDICGCSIDAVHRDDHQRIAECEALAATLLQRSFEAIVDGRGGDATQPYALNPHPWPLVACFELPAGQGGAVIASEGGAVIASEGGAPQEAGPASEGPPRGEARREAPTPRLLRLPGLSCTACGQAEEVPLGPHEHARLQRHPGGLRLSNGLLQAEIDARGLAALHHPASQLTGAPLLSFCDEGDAGDTYDFCPPREQHAITGPTAAAALHEQTAAPFAVSVEGRTALRVPRELVAASSRRSRRQSTLGLKLRWTLAAGCPWLALDLELTNNARDHRLRLALQLPGKRTVLAQTPFALSQHHTEVAQSAWTQPPSTTHPFQDLLIMEGERGGLGIFAPGLREYEWRHQGGQTELWITLLRAVGWLSRPRLATRPGEAGPCWPLRDAQQPGPMRLRLGFMPFAGRWQESHLLRAAAEFASPPRLFSLPADGSRSRLGQATPAAPEIAPKPTPAPALGLEVGGRGIAVSSIRPAGGGAIELRVVNLLREPSSLSLRGDWARIEKLTAVGADTPALALDARGLSRQPKETGRKEPGRGLQDFRRLHLAPPFDPLPLGAAEIATFRLYARQTAAKAQRPQ